jgi:hypothetical protein
VRTPLLIGLLTALLATSCTSMQNGQAQSTSGEPPSKQSTPSSPPSSPDTPSAGPGTGLPAHGAPKVQSPLNVESFPQTPCRLLSAPQAQELGVTSPGKQREGVTSPACDWSNSDTGAGLGLQFETATKLGLSRTYELRNTYGYFIELPLIEGYPAVAAATADGRGTGTCALWVGVTDQLAFTMSVILSIRGRQEKKDPCQAAQIAAGMMVKTMKGAA